MLPGLQVFGLHLPTAPLTALLGGYLALGLASRELRRRGLSEELPYDAAVYALVAALLAARLWYVGRHLEAYLQSPGLIVSLNTGTLALLPGAAAGLAAALALSWRRRALSWALADAHAPALALAAAAVSLASLLAGTSYGQPSQAPWAIELWGAARHPTQVYQLLLDLAALGAAYRLGSGWPDGTRFLVTVALLASGRLIVEGFRAESTLLSGGFRLEQLVFLAAGLAALYVAGRRSTTG